MKKTIITDISLKKTDYLSGMRDLQAELQSRDNYSSNGDLNKSPLHDLISKNSNNKDQLQMTFLKGLGSNAPSSQGVLGPGNRFFVKSKNNGN